MLYSCSAPVSHGCPGHLPHYLWFLLKFELPQSSAVQVLRGSDWAITSKAPRRSNWTKVPGYFDIPLLGDRSAIRANRSELDTSAKCIPVGVHATTAPARAHIEPLEKK